MPPPLSKPDPSERSVADGSRKAQELYRYTGVGIQFAATIGIFAWLGHRTDVWLGSSPWFLLVGVFLGFAGGLVSLIKKFSPPSPPTPPKPPGTPSP